MTLLSSAARFARSPQGKKLADQAKKLAQDPKTKAKIAEVREKLADRQHQQHHAPKSEPGQSAPPPPPAG